MFHRYDSDASNEKGVITHTRPRPRELAHVQNSSKKVKRSAQPRENALKMPVGRGLKNSGPAPAPKQSQARQNAGAAVVEAEKVQETSHVAECLGSFKHHAAAAQEPHALSAWGSVRQRQWWAQLFSACVWRVEDSGLQRHVCGIHNGS